jgi:uncharacterized damage-inducible protein DinB
MQQVAQPETFLDQVITPEYLLQHWQGHRRLTRKVIEAFPEEALFSYSIGGMRPFAEMVMEFIDMSKPGITGIVTGDWPSIDAVSQHKESLGKKDKTELLATWDEITTHIDNLWSQIPGGRFQEIEKAFGVYEDRIIGTLLYFIENEIHHRGQGFVYLRSLGIEPPAFWDRY